MYGLFPCKPIQPTKNVEFWILYIQHFLVYTQHFFLHISTFSENKLTFFYLIMICSLVSTKAPSDPWVSHKPTGRERFVKLRTH
jgi:hypothetical protein